MSRKQRKLRNILVTPKFQLKLSLYYILSGLVIIGIMIGLIYDRLMKARELMNNSPMMNFEIQAQINDLMFEIVQISLFGFFGFIIFSFIFALVISHRIAGPVVAITAYIEQLKQGNFDYQRNLRPNDELTEIMDGLHELSAVLKQKS
ncbi:MAG: hypothetical protein HUJ31_11600 [Pseudomonadales bacterium]|nr:hypothetical protein [Pseudomonadales bacterium]